MSCVGFVAEQWIIILLIFLICSQRYVKNTFFCFFGTLPKLFCRGKLTGASPLAFPPATPSNAPLALFQKKKQQSCPFFESSLQFSHHAFFGQRVSLILIRRVFGTASRDGFYKFNQRLKIIGYSPSPKFLPIFLLISLSSLVCSFPVYLKMILSSQRLIPKPKHAKW